MLSSEEIIRTIEMLKNENLDVRTVTLGISLRDCVSSSSTELCTLIRSKIKRVAGEMASVCDQIANKYGIPIVNKRLAVTPIASPLLVGPGSIVNVMLIDNQQGRLFALGACVVAFVGVILILNYAHVLYRLMGRIGALAVGRMMQIFIVAIGIKFCFGALAKVFPVLVK